mmetsp:Transcript_81508/g.95006  ORF Transcript_81508/g.95006 Transcript_81508/m.95006 type:complete len:257 (+) Transcript_81508:627-1397(+)
MCHLPFLTIFLVISDFLLILMVLQQWFLLVVLLFHWILLKMMVMMSLLCFFLVLLSEDDWLRQQHHRDGDHNNYEENSLNGALSGTISVSVEWLTIFFRIKSTDFKHQINEDVNNARSSASIFVMCCPLEEDQHNHVTKGGEKEADLRDPFEKEVKLGFEEDRIEHLKHGSHYHLRHSDDNREFHFERVEESKFIRFMVPGRIETEWVHAVFFASYNRAGGGIAGAKEVPRHCHEVVVDKTAVERKETHHSKQVSC